MLHTAVVLSLITSALCRYLYVERINSEKEKSNNYFDSATQVQHPIITFAEDDGSSEDESNDKGLFINNINDDDTNGGDVDILSTFNVEEKQQAEHTIENVSTKDDDVVPRITGDGLTHNGDVYHLTHGDIMVKARDDTNIFTNVTHSAKFPNNHLYRRKWSVNIPYEFNPIIDGIKKRTILSALDEIQDKTCITFRGKERFDTDYLSFTSNRKLCWSFVGRQGGRQEISIGDGCGFKSIIIHEVMHALEFYHTHERIDRDEYIEILKENIDKNFTTNFDYVIDNINASIYSQPYDFLSVMHFKRNAFGKINKISRGEVSLQTIKQLRPPYYEDFGQPLKGGLSMIDQRQINDMYCEDPRPIVRIEELEQFLRHKLQEYIDIDNYSLYQILKKKLHAIYKDYFFSINIWKSLKSVTGGSYFTNGGCAHIWNQQNRSIVVCYAKIKSIVKIDWAVRALTWHEVFTKLQLLNSCDPVQVAKEGYQEAITHKSPVIMILAVRTGHKFVSGTKGYAKQGSFKCDGNREMKVIIFFGSLF